MNEMIFEEEGVLRLWCMQFYIASHLREYDRLHQFNQIFDYQVT